MYTGRIDKGNQQKQDNFLTKKTMNKTRNMANAENI